MMLDRLAAAAELACVMPWEKSKADVPYAHRSAFLNECDPVVICALIEVAKAAKALDTALQTKEFVSVERHALSAALERMK